MMKFLAILLLAGCRPALFGGGVAVVEAMEKIARSAPVEKREPAVWQLAALRNEHELTQLVFTGGSAGIEAASITVQALTQANGAEFPAAAVTVRQARYLKLTEQVPEPVELPDALMPYDGSPFAVAAGQNQSFYFDWFIAPETPPGIYSGCVTVQIDAERWQIPLTLTVYPPVLPQTPSYQSAFAIWDNQLLVPYPELTEESPEYQRLKENIYEFLLDYRLNAGGLPVPLESPEAEAYLADPRVNTFSIPCDLQRPEQFVACCDYLRERGWLSRGFVYPVDEPDPSAYEMCVQTIEAIHRLAPDARVVIPTNHPVAPLLEKQLDIWCPNLNHYSPAYFQARQQLGERVWWYTCVWPPPPYPTYLVNDTATAPRLLGWLQARYRVEGSLYWAVNIWQKFDWQSNRYVPRDIWNDPLAYPGGNGDGFLIYPGTSPAARPVPSLRLEMIRQGNEDFELLMLLKKAMQAAADRLHCNYDADRRIEQAVNRIAPSLTVFDRSAAGITELRQELLRELTALTNGEPALLTLSEPEGTRPAGTVVSGELHTRPAIRPAATVNGQSLPLSGGDGKYTFELTLPPGSTELRIQAGSTALLRRFSVPSVEPVAENILDWNAPETIGLLSLNHLELVGPPREAPQLIVPADCDFPNLRIPLGPNRRYLYVVLRNYTARLTEIFLKLHDRDKSFELYKIALPPAGTESACIEITPGHYEQLEFWLQRQSCERKFSIEQLAWYSDLPVKQMPSVAAAILPAGDLPRNGVAFRVKEKQERKK